MIQIRRGIFETNSSSVHSLTFVTDAEYEKFLSGEYVFDKWEGRLVDKNNIEKEYDDYGEPLYDYSYRYYDSDPFKNLAYEYGGEVYHETVLMPDGGHCNYLLYY